MRLSVIVPAYNESGTIAEVLRRVRALPLDIELIVVDDGSTDATREQAAGAPGVDRLIVHERNRGKGAAVRSGLAAASGDVIVIQDADLELDPADLVPMVERIERNGARVVYGSRVLARGPIGSLPYYLGGRLVTAVANALYGLRLTDAPTCYKMFRREVLTGLDLRSDGFEFCPEVTAKIARRGHEIVEVPIRYVPRTTREGKKLRFRHGLTAIWTLLRWRFWR